MKTLENSKVKKSGISQDNVSFYNDLGYLVAEDLLTKEDIDLLKQETAQIFRGNRGKINGLAQVEPSHSDEDILKKYVAIHFPHKISPVIKDFLSHKKVVEILQTIVSPNVKCMQSMLFVKAPGKQGQSWHQDEYFIPTRDKSLVGAWIAIDDASIENGCLWIVPGSHKPSFIRKRLKNENPEFADSETLNLSEFKSENIIPVEVKSGSVIFFNGYLLHSSLKNKTKNTFRTALVNHYMSAESMLPWDQDGKLESTEDLRDIVMVAGKDPYKSKGIVDVNKPYLRQAKTVSKTDNR